METTSCTTTASRAEQEPPQISCLGRQTILAEIRTTTKTKPKVPTNKDEAIPEGGRQDQIQVVVAQLQGVSKPLATEKWEYRA